MIWDRALGYHWLPLQTVQYSNDVSLAAILKRFKIFVFFPVMCFESNWITRSTSNMYFMSLGDIFVCFFLRNTLCIWRYFIWKTFVNPYMYVWIFIVLQNLCLKLCHFQSDSNRFEIKKCVSSFIVKKLRFWLSENWILSRKKCHLRRKTCL